MNSIARKQRDHRSIRRLRKRPSEGVTVLLINKKRPLPMPPCGQSARSFRIDSPFRTNIHEYAHRHSRAPVTKGAVTRDVIRTYRCPHDNPSASELSIPNELRASPALNPRISWPDGFLLGSLGWPMILEVEIESPRLDPQPLHRLLLTLC